MTEPKERVQYWKDVKKRDGTTARELRYEKLDYSVYNISKDDFDKMVKSTKTPEEEALLLLTGRSALRAMEVRHLRKRNIDLDRGVVVLEIYKGHKRYHKTTEELTVPLFESCSRVLRFIIGKKNKDDYLFPSLYGTNKPMSENTLLKTIGSIAKRAGVESPLPQIKVKRVRKGKEEEYVKYKDVIVHLLRHSAVRYILDETKAKYGKEDWRLAQKIARHSDIRTTLNRYGQMSQEEKIKRFKELE